MSTERDCYQSYLLRVWRAQYHAKWQWRAVLECPQTGERQSFADLEQLFAFLRERHGENAPRAQAAPSSIGGDV